MVEQIENNEREFMGANRILHAMCGAGVLFYAGEFYTIIGRDG